MADKAQASAKRKGLVEIFTGNGKGKTSAALGVVMRALGHDLKIRIIFFMKGDFPYGEQKMLSSFPNVDMSVYGTSEFVSPRNVRQIDRDEGKKAFDAAREAVMSGKYDLVVLDEINVASAWGIVDMEEVIKLIKEKPEHVELILTGRYADPRLVRLASLVTEMVAVKHPYDEGIPSRAGLDY